MQRFIDDVYMELSIIDKKLLWDSRLLTVWKLATKRKKSFPTKSGLLCLALPHQNINKSCNETLSFKTPIDRRQNTLYHGGLPAVEPQKNIGEKV